MVRRRDTTGLDNGKTFMWAGSLELIKQEKNVEIAHTLSCTKTGENMQIQNVRAGKKGKGKEKKI